MIRSDLYTLWQRKHRRPIVNGAPAGTYADDVARSVVDPGGPGTARKLAFLGVTAIVTRRGALDYATEETPDLPNARWGPGYRLLERFPDGSSVWRVTARPAPALATLPSSDWADPLPPNGGFVGNPLRRGSGLIEIEAPARRVVLLRFDTRTVGSLAHRLTIAGLDGALTVPLAGRTRVSALVHVPRGRSILNLIFEPEPSELTVAISPPWTEPASGRPRLRAVPLPPGD